MGLAQSAVGFAQPTAGLVQPAVGLAQPAVGLAQPAVGLAQLAVGLTKRFVELGQPPTGGPAGYRVIKSCGWVAQPAIWWVAHVILVSPQSQLDLDFKLIWDRRDISF